MANLDSQSKRMSGMNPASPWRGSAKAPTGAFTQGERQAVDYMYSGITAASAATFQAAWANNANAMIRKRS